MSGIMAAASVMSGYAQAPASFEEFRQSMYNDFNNFKSRILEHYADFLAGEWHEYEPLEGTSKYSEPKPETPPVFELLSEENMDPQTKEFRVSLGFGGDLPLDSERDLREPSLMSVLRSGKAVFSMPSLAEAVSAVTDSVAADSVSSHAEAQLAMQQPEDGIMTADGIVAEYDGDVFGFYGMRFGMPKEEFTAMDSLVKTLDFAKQWDRLTADSVADRVNPHILALQKKTGLSDYLMYEMTMAYLDHKLHNANDASKMSVAHYLLANMGFGVRIAMDENDNPLMLLPFTEDIYGRSRVNLSKWYYVYGTPGREEKPRRELRSPYVPSNASEGKSLNLRMNGLNLPVKKYHYSIAHNDMKLEGDLNENVMAMIYRYPQMTTSGFAASMISPEVRDDVVKQVKEQLAGMEPMKAADKLLSMIQYGFPYATDDNFHGFEKPYFFEEMLYYPKSDCEDRSVFFSYLLWNALGLENDLITYPNHEATAIKADQVWGGYDHYYRKANKFFISDPTYIGAATGQCMPRYIGVQPGIDLSYE